MWIVDKTVGELSVDGILCGLLTRQSASCQLTVYYVDCRQSASGQLTVYYVDCRQDSRRVVG